MVKTRTKKLTERWGAETSAKGTRFKLNRDMAGYHSSNRAGIDIEEAEPEVKIKLPDVPPVKVSGSLIHMEKAKLGYKVASTAVRKTGRAESSVTILEEVNLTLEQGDRIALVGRVSLMAAKRRRYFCRLSLLKPPLLQSIVGPLISPEWERQIHRCKSHHWTAHPSLRHRGATSRNKDRLL
jgi:hypothetical protein